MTETTTCECSEEYGPCEEHGEVLAQREGASTRTADELLLVWCDDATAIVGESTPWGRELIARAWRDAVVDGDHGCHWLSEEHGDAIRSDLETLQSQLESSLATMDTPALTFWNDGYTIVTITGGPLLEDEHECTYDNDEDADNGYCNGGCVTRPHRWSAWTRDD